MMSDLSSPTSREGPGGRRVAAVDLDRLLTAEQLANRWQVPTSQVYRLTRDGRIPAVKLGRYYRYAPAAIEAFEIGTGQQEVVWDAS
jgi:excisionase family DNA binding protein